MSEPVVFDSGDADRIGQAVRAYEAGALLPKQSSRRNPTSPISQWIQVTDSLPGGYDGTAAVDGVVLFPQGSGTNHETVNVFIKSINDTPLEAGSVQRGWFAYNKTISGVTKPVFMTDAVPESSGGGGYVGELCHGYYDGGGFTDSGSTYGYGYTTCKAVIWNGSSYDTETWTLANQSGGPLWAARTSYNNSSPGWTAVPIYGGYGGAGVARFSGVRGPGNHCIHYTIAPVCVPVSFDYDKISGSGSDIFRDRQFQLRTPIAGSGLPPTPSGQWFALPRDGANYGAICRPIELQQYLLVATSPLAGVTQLNLNLTQSFTYSLPGDLDSYFGTPRRPVLGTVGYNPATGWHVISVGLGAKSDNSGLLGKTVYSVPTGQPIIQLS